MNKLLIYNCQQVVTPEGNELIKGQDMDQVKIINRGSIYSEGGIIRDVGINERVLKNLGVVSIESLPTDIQIIDATGNSALPGFVDSHTHFVFGGYREEEFMERLTGVSYLDIMRRGGGIQSTVNATRNSSFEELYKKGYKYLKDMLSQGVTTVEGKSGYGLDLECEIKQLKVMKRLNEKHPIEVVPTFLGAHAIPLEYNNRTADYLKYMIETVMPKVKEERLAEFCDVFCEEGAFNREESKQLLTTAKDMGFQIKIHADEINDLGGTMLALELDAVSADHLLKASQDSITRLAACKTAATVLPCTAYCLNKPFAPAKAMIEAGCGVALATDFNPGSSFTNSIPLMLSLAVMKMGMTLNEALTAITLNGAAALNRAKTVGSLEVGKRADIVLLDYPDYRFLIYHTAKNIVRSVVKDGELVYKK